MSIGVGLDLGASSLRFASGGHVSSVGPLVMLDSDGRVRADDARRTWFDGRDKAGNHWAQPVSRGAVIDQECLEGVVAHLLRCAGVRRFSGARVVVAAPPALTDLAHRSILRAATEAGAATVRLVDPLVAMAIGASLDLHLPRGLGVVQVGASATVAGVLSLGHVLRSAWAPVGVSDIDAALVSYLRSHRGVLVEVSEAARARLAVFDANDDAGPIARTTVAGIHARTGDAIDAPVTARDVRIAAAAVLSRIAAVVRDGIRDVSPDIAQDLIVGGVNLGGGGAHLRGLHQYIATSAGILVRDLPNPAHGAVIGASRCASALPSLNDYFLATA